MNAAKFREVLEDLRAIMEKEERSYGGGERRGGVIRLRSRGTFGLVGDVHGDHETMLRILKDVEGQAEAIAFLGDYIDRGPPEGQVRVIEELHRLKASMGEKAILLRGNHEPGWGILSFPHDYPLALRRLFGSAWRELYELSVKLFESMPHALIIEGQLLALHGGPPVEPAADPFEYLAHGREEGRLVEILFNDPSEEVEERAPSPRGAGYLWGPRVTRRALEIAGVKLIFRGHEPAFRGYKLNHDNKVITLFSRLGAPYYNARAAYALCSPEDLLKPEGCLRTFG
ncbi:MAG: serine/threonine protein phosphatase [Acidilobaceae archaeon]|nr:serine/threonine protein phosphatase [Acidilobaceae archaeon]